MRRKIASILFLLVFPPVIYMAAGQTAAESKLKRSSDSALAVELYKKALNFSIANNFDSCLVSVSKSIELASENGFYLTGAAGYELLSGYFDKQSDWEDALANYLRAAAAYNKGNDRKSEARIFRRIASKYYTAGVYNKSASYAEQEFILYNEPDYEKLAEAAETAARSYFYLPSDSLSLKWYNAASHYSLMSADSTGYLRCAERIATLYSQSGKYDLALEHLNILLKAYSKKNDYKGMASVSNQSGVILFRKGDLKNAHEILINSVNYSEKSGKDDYFLTDVWSNIAVCDQNLGDETEMLVAFKRALMHAKASGRTDEAARIDRIIATVYFNRHDNYHAELYCLDCIESAKKSGNLDVLQLCYKDYSAVLESGNDFVKALEYYEKHLNLRDSLNFEARLAEKEKNDRVLLLESDEQRIKSELSNEEIKGLELKNLKTDARRRENELMLLHKQQELDRSEKNRLSQSLTLEKERFELNKRVQDIKSLKQQQAIDSLRLVQKDDSTRVLSAENQLLAKDKEQKETQLKNEKLAKRFAVGIGSLSLLVAIIILYGLISTRKKNQKLAESKKQIELINSDLETKNTEVLKQKDIIELKNQAITDSIQYASRIQTAVLPPVDFLSEWGFENFILFKPKDIVSGDFYWGVKKDERIIVAAGDCTGHGVPGAFMSMLGHAFLDEIVNTKKVVNAATILNFLRDEIISALKQKGTTGETRDGMDISLVVIDLPAGKLDYAGANNPLYLIRDGKLIRYQADRMPIGIHFINFTPFTNQVVEIRKGDYLYLFSDGYADQFGGQKGKKFMYKPFQELLVKVHDKPMDIQKTILDNTFEKFKNDNEQVDDVLVIGIRL